jgi:SpoVK/Ycf46/Vps4 family AAA+-type ATPase
MKKKNVLNLIKYYVDKNDSAFTAEAYEIASDFDKNHEYQLSQYIVSLLNNTNTFVPQDNEELSSFIMRIKTDNNPLPLPKAIEKDILGIINAINKKAGVNKFIFEGMPGTGKTESAKHIARILERDLFIVNFETLIDSKMGQTAKNIVELFNELNNLRQPNKAIILFDEIDAIAIDRINNNDVREMGRATSAILKGFDNLNENIVLIATTNLFKAFDKALIRRFDAVINFNRYSKDDLIEISTIIVNELSKKFKNISINNRLLKKIIVLLDPIPYPGDLRNLLKSTIAFSDPNNENDYFRRLFSNTTSLKDINDLKKLRELGFSVRDIEIIAGISKSKVAREIKQEDRESNE